jgi:AcrR family transcriptional regulator
MLSASTRVGTLSAMAAITRPYHHGNLRQALLERAEVALAAGGPGSLSLRELAREIGVSHAAPRRHFADKQALLDALAESGFAQLRDDLSTAIAGAEADFTSRLSAFAHAYVRFATEHAALLELMFAVKHRPGATDALRRAGEAAFAAPLALIAEGQANGDVVAGGRERIATIALAALHGVAALANSDLLGDRPLDEIVSEAVQRLLLGLRPR